MVMHIKCIVVQIIRYRKSKNKKWYSDKRSECNDIFGPKCRVSVYF